MNQGIRGVPTVKCPTCGRQVAWVESEKFRPFCCERCRLIDLGEWATGSYAIPVNPLEEDPDSHHDE